MLCQYCNGTKETLALEQHAYTKRGRTISIPCICLVSEIVSRENKLLKGLGDEYLHPDKLDPQLVFNPTLLRKSPNLFIQGDYASFRIQVKALMMRHRFQTPKPRILFSRSIDILHDYYVQNADGESLHIAAVSVFDLVIVALGVLEKNQALATCLAQLVANRKQENKPTWLFLPAPLENFTTTTCAQEYSADLEGLIADFQKIKNQTETELTKEKKFKDDGMADYIPGKK